MPSADNGLDASCWAGCELPPPEDAIAHFFVLGRKEEMGHQRAAEAKDRAEEEARRAAEARDQAEEEARRAVEETEKDEARRIAEVNEAERAAAEAEKIERAEEGAAGDGTQQCPSACPS